MPELTTPATAGWRRPVIMLPDDWRSWDDADCTAVLAHELAHVHRRDYAAGLIARLALVFEFYHPLVHWMARRLQLQQELAADSVGGTVRGGYGTVPAHIVAPGPQAGRKVSELAGEGVPPGAWDPDQEDRHVAE